MPKLSRKDTKIFSALAANVIQFGSTRQGSAVPSTDPDVLQLLAAYEEGWNSGVIGGTEVPPKGEFNALQFIVSRALAYLEQETLVEYTLTTEYHTDSIARTPTGTTLYKSATDDNVGNDIAGNAAYDAGTTYNIGDRALDTNGDIYVSLTNGNIGNLLTDPVNWELAWVFLGDLASLKQVATAASQPEVDAGVVANKYVSPSTLLGLFNASSQAIDGIARIPVNIGGAFDEIIIQWGIAVNISGNTISDVTLPIAYDTANLFSLASIQGSNVGITDPVMSSVLSTSQIRITNAFSSSVNANWLSIGY
jgi:hypothetical protein